MTTLEGRYLHERDECVLKLGPFRDKHRKPTLGLLASFEGLGSNIQEESCEAGELRSIA